MISTIRPDAITETAVIHAHAAVVWQYLTMPDLMTQWMLDTAMTMVIRTDWQVGSPIVMAGEIHGIAFENRGTVLRYEPETLLQYTQLSSLSQLPPTPENFYQLTLALTPTATGTLLTLTITNFPTSAIFKHLEFYWRVALVGLKKQIEQSLTP